ncbi:hypothetical protein [Micromonospora sp. NPDC049891]|uniref:hypothetical protein n=1 Tax=Micromonospora sp. NPDC049891 TaxID=3155655 RepID=UPI0033E2F6B6
MDALDDFLRHAHVWNSWIVLIIGCAALGALVASARRRDVARRDRRVLSAFVGGVHLQVILGVVLALLLMSVGDDLFAGDSAKAGWHAALGVAAAGLATLALRLWRWSDRPWPAVFAAAAALVAAQLGRLPLIVLGTFVAAGVAELVRRRTPPQARQPMPEGEESR